LTKGAQNLTESEGLAKGQGHKILAGLEKMFAEDLGILMRSCSPTILLFLVEKKAERLT
jgi:hypothetical protein